MKSLARLSIGKKFGIAWLVWLSVFAIYCIMSISAVSVVTRQAEGIYSDRLRPTEALNTTASNLTALEAVLQNPEQVQDVARFAHGYVPLLRGRVILSMGQYWSSYQSSIDQSDQIFRTAPARRAAQTLFREEGQALGEWEQRWGRAQDLVDRVSMPNPPQDFDKQIQDSFSAALESVTEIANINDRLGQVEAQDAQRVARQALLGAIGLGILALAVVALVALIQQRLIVHPLKRLTQAADRARHGDLAARVDIGAQDEIGTLATAFNSMMAALGDAHERMTAQNLALQDHARALELLAEAERAKRHAEVEASRLKSEFLANMSHELRTPMNSVIGYGQVLAEEMDGSLNPEQKEDVERILGSGRHLLELINDILDLSKIESGKMSFHLEAFSLANVIEPALATVQPLAAQKGLELELELPADAGMVYADPAKVRQILLNLLSNAIKFTPSGVVRIEAERREGTIEIRVIDNGIGIPDTAQEYIFEEFRQVDGSTSRKFGGTGLGLAISRKLARLQNGDITVESSEGAGSVFCIRLPAAGAEGAAPVKLEAAPEGSSSRRALCIDDDPAALGILIRHLSSAGYEVMSALGPEEGLELARSWRPDVITLDVMMPTRDGWETLGDLKSDPALANIPVIIVSIVENSSLALALGAAEAVPKPIDHARLISSVEKARAGASRSEVLVVDDDAETCALVGQALHEARYDVSFARNGVEALQRIQSRPPDVLVLDMRMPVMDGFGLIRLLQERAITLPVVVLTALELTPLQRERFSDDVVDVVGKSPYSTGPLLEAVRRAAAAPAARSSGDCSYG